MSCLKKWARMEPLVDYAPPGGLVTTDCPVLDVDLEKCTVADLDFCSEYRITAKRTDYIHAIVGWFETHFTHGQQNINLSTGKYSFSSSTKFL
jgi:protein arginine N-methyltransferase 1